MRAFSGAWPALLTPVDGQGKVNPTVAGELIEFLLDRGADGFYVCGSTGQGVHMSVAERKLMLKTSIDQINGRVPVIAHIGSMVTDDAVELAHHAKELGADGISSIIPPQFDSIDILFRYFSTIAEAAPDLPLLPYILSTSIDIVAFMQKLLEIPSVVGTKYTGPSMFELNEIAQMGHAARPGTWTIFSGMDEQCLYAAMSGSSGNIGSTLNFMMGVYKAIHAAHQAGDLAEANALQLRANEVTRVAIKFGFHGTMRELMAMQGLSIGGPLLPALPLDAERRAEFHAQMAKVGFEEIAAMKG